MLCRISRCWRRWPSCAARTRRPPGRFRPQETSLSVQSPRSLLAAFAVLASAAPAQIVQVERGAVRGAALEGGAVFRGIPFAAPPLDHLRWKKPMPVARWGGVLDTTRPTASCVQNDYGWNRADFLIGRENC